MSAIAQEKHIQDIGEVKGIGGEVIDLRVIPESEAKEVIKKYIREHPGCITSEIIENLRLDPALAVETLVLLEEEGKVRGEEVE